MAHIHEKVDFTVEVFIVHNNKVLLRMHDKYNIWMSVGGHIELDENPIEAALREVKEEVGLDVTIVGSKPETTEIDENYDHLISPRFLGEHKVNDIHKHVVMVYFAKSDTEELSDSISEHERSETCWVTKEELDRMDLAPNIRFYATEALKALAK
jgi:8-oxo-dGTP pyrophosphatase MutT (NUDIX family)